MTTIKCPHCGQDVEIPHEIDDAAKKWMARNETQRQIMKDRRNSVVHEGKLQTLNIQGGSILLNGEKIVMTDDIRIFVRPDGPWDGWANIGFRSLLANPMGLLALRNNQPGEYMIELGDNGPRSKIIRTNFVEGARTSRLVFMGIGTLNVESQPSS